MLKINLVSLTVVVYRFSIEDRRYVVVRDRRGALSVFWTSTVEQLDALSKNAGAAN